MGSFPETQNDLTLIITGGRAKNDAGMPVKQGAPNVNFRKNICSEDDLISRENLRSICRKISCLSTSPRIFEI